MACGIFVLFGNIVGEYGSAVLQCNVGSVNISVILTYNDVFDVIIIVFEIINVVGYLNVNACGENDRNTLYVIASRLINRIKGVARDLDVLRGIDLNGVPLAVVGEFALVDVDIVDGERISGCNLAGSFNSDTSSEGLLTRIEVIARVIKEATIDQNVTRNGALAPFGLGGYQKSRIIYVAEGAMLQGNIS